MELVGSDRGLVGEVASVHGPPSLQTRFPFRETSVSSHTAPPPPASWVCPPAPCPRRGAPKGLHLVFQESLLVPCALPSLVTDSCCGHPVAREDPQGTSSPYTPHSCQPQACSLPSVSFHVPRHLPFGVLGPALRASQCSRVPGGPAGAVVRCLSRVIADPPPRRCPGAAPSRSLAALPPGPGLVSGPTLPFEYSLSGSPEPRGGPRSPVPPLLPRPRTCKYCRVWLGPLSTHAQPRVTSPVPICPHTEGLRPGAYLTKCPRGLST